VYANNIPSPLLAEAGALNYRPKWRGISLRSVEMAKRKTYATTMETAFKQLTLDGTTLTCFEAYRTIARITKKRELKKNAWELALHNTFKEIWIFGHRGLNALYQRDNWPAEAHPHSAERLGEKRAPHRRHVQLGTRGPRAALLTERLHRGKDDDRARVRTRP
jgi:hypothetical protein